MSKPKTKSAPQKDSGRLAQTAAWFAAAAAVLATVAGALVNLNTIGEFLFPAPEIAVRDVRTTSALYEKRPPSYRQVTDVDISAEAVIEKKGWGGAKNCRAEIVFDPAGSAYSQTFSLPWYRRVQKKMDDLQFRIHLVTYQMSMDKGASFRVACDDMVSPLVPANLVKPIDVPPQQG